MTGKVDVVWKGSLSALRFVVQVPGRVSRGTQELKNRVVKSAFSTRKGSKSASQNSAIASAGADFTSASSPQLPPDWVQVGEQSHGPTTSSLPSTNVHIEPSHERSNNVDNDGFEPNDHPDGGGAASDTIIPVQRQELGNDRPSGQERQEMSGQLVQIHTRVRDQRNRISGLRSVSLTERKQLLNILDQILGLTSNEIAAGSQGSGLSALKLTLADLIERSRLTNELLDRHEKELGSLEAYLYSEEQQYGAWAQAVRSTQHDEPIPDTLLANEVAAQAPSLIVKEGTTNDETQKIHPLLLVLHQKQGQVTIFEERLDELAEEYLEEHMDIDRDSMTSFSSRAIQKRRSLDVLRDQLIIDLHRARNEAESARQKCLEANIDPESGEPIPQYGGLPEVDLPPPLAEITPDNRHEKYPMFFNAPSGSAFAFEDDLLSTFYSPYDRVNRWMLDVLRSSSVNFLQYAAMAKTWRRTIEPRMWDLVRERWLNEEVVDRTTSSIHSASIATQYEGHGVAPPSRMEHRDYVLEESDLFQGLGPSN